MKAAFESPDIPGYVYLLEHSRASDGGGSKVDRRGIETYLLAQLAAPVHQLPLSIRGNFGYPLPPRRVRAQLPREIRISQICFRRCTLNSGCFREMINHTLVRSAREIFLAFLVVRIICAKMAASKNAKIRRL